MLNHYDKIILQKDEEIVRLNNQVKILQNMKKQLIKELNEAEDEIKDLECKLKEEI